MKIIALEEHLNTPDVLSAWQALPPDLQDMANAPVNRGDIGRRLAEIGPERFAAMDETGVDVQVISLTSPGLHNLPPDQATALQRATNDRIAEAVAANPDRLQGFATLATPAPAAAAAELERAVTKLGLNGAMIFGRTQTRNLDHPDNWPIFEAASALAAPLYLHPQSPAKPVREAYYSGLNDLTDWVFARPGIGWHYETGVQLLRLILAGVFDRFPDLKIIVGHWGEAVLFYLDRIDVLAHAAKLPQRPSDYVRNNVLITPSGIFSQRYLRWAIEVVGIGHIMMSVDYPYQTPAQNGARRFLEESDLNQSDREKIASGNWQRLCAAIRR